MIGNIIVVLAVCGAVFYLYLQWKKIKASDSPSCAGCSACGTNKKDQQNTIFNSMEDANADTKEK